MGRDVGSVKEKAIVSGETVGGAVGIADVDHGVARTVVKTSAVKGLSAGRCVTGREDGQGAL